MTLAIVCVENTKHYYGFEKRITVKRLKELFFKENPLYNRSDWGRNINHEFVDVKIYN
jgi:hypothetical protein